MKKLLYIVPLLLGMALTSCYDEDIENINSRLDAIENAQIATISQQITSINNSIQLLTDTDTELKGYIATLEKDVEQSKADIEALKAKDSAIEELIAELRSYVDSELKSAQDWATATFATLEQYNALASELASLKTYVEGVESSLNNAILALETSMKEWVNEQLTGYYTIAEIDTKLEALETATTEGDEALQKEIDALKEQLTVQKTELTEAYSKAIEESINTNNGVIDDKIAAEISAVNEKIGALEKQLDSLEERISAVEDAIEQIKALDITFDTTEKACMAGASASVDYTIVGGDEQTTIEAFGDGGWSADIVAESATTGKVVVTAPSEISKRGKVVVLATSGAGGVAMKSLYFDEGVLTGILDTYEVDWEACTLAVTLKTNLSYSVEIPADAQEWISIAESTRATVRTETFTLSIAENPEDMPIRSAVVKLVGECGDILQSFEVTQKLRPSSTPIVFADPIVKKVCVEKFDTNGDGELSELEASRVGVISGESYNSSFFGDVSSVVFSFDELKYFINLIAIDDFAFLNCVNLKRVTIPNNTWRIGYSAFSGCSSLESIAIPNSVEMFGSYTYESNKVFSNIVSLKNIYISDIATIGIFAGSGIMSSDATLWVNGEILTEYSFPQGTVTIDSRLKGCENIVSVTIPDGVTSIGESAFRDCTSLTSITIPDSVTSIGDYTFRGCSSLTSITIPYGVTWIGKYAFYRCTSLTSITIPDSITSIGGSAFYGCTSLTSITIPDSIASIGDDTFYGCSSLKEVYCKPTTPPSGGDNMFDNNASDRKIYVPNESVEAYKTASYWKDYASSIEGYDFE